MIATLEEIEQHRWSRADELLANIVEQLDKLARITIQAHSSEAVEFGPPLRVPRPHDLARRVSGREFARRFMGGG